MTGDEYVQLYAQICDVVERTYQHWPLVGGAGGDGHHTSRDARATANLILDLCGIADPVPFADRLAAQAERRRENGWVAPTIA